MSIGACYRCGAEVDKQGDLCYQCALRHIANVHREFEGDTDEGQRVCKHELRVYGDGDAVYMECDICGYTLEL